MAWGGPSEILDSLQEREKQWVLTKCCIHLPPCGRSNQCALTRGPVAQSMSGPKAKLCLVLILLRVRCTSGLVFAGAQSDLSDVYLRVVQGCWVVWPPIGVRFGQVYKLVVI